MNRVIRFYNQNRKMFWTIVLTIVGVIALIQTLNNYAKNSQKSSGISNTTTYNNIQNPIIAGSIIEKQTSIELAQIINEFISLCNNKQIEKAYELLSDDCKQELYPDVETFKKNYCDKIFSEYRLYDIKAWITTNKRITYKIEITEDILSTGSNSGLSIQEFYTVVKQGDEYKLNVHNYIGKETLNSSKAISNVTFNIIEKYIYMDYEIYKIEIKNSSNKKIMVDSKGNSRTVNVTDQNGLKYTAFLNEIGENDLIVFPRMTKQIKIKFNKSYNPKYIEQNIEFLDVILDINDKTDKTSISVEL